MSRRYVIRCPHCNAEVVAPHRPEGLARYKEHLTSACPVWAKARRKMLARIHHEGRRKMAEKTKLEEELGPQNDTERLVWAATYGAAFTALLARSPYTMVQAAAKRELINTAATNAVVAAREAILALRRGPVDP